MAKPDHPKLDSASDAFVARNAETIIYKASPFGFWGTTTVSFIIAFGSHILIAKTIGQRDIFSVTQTGFALNGTSWIGLIISLIFATALALPERRRGRWATHRAELIASLQSSGHKAAHSLIDGSDLPRLPSYFFFYAGCALGLVLNIYILRSQALPIATYLSTIGLWFSIFVPIVWGLGFRAGVSVAQESRRIKALIETYLDVDIFHLDKLHVYGRIGLSGARSWLILVAILLLFIADPDQMVMATISVVLAMLGAALVLNSALRPVHAKIRSAKELELVRVREQMLAVRTRALSGDSAAASALAGLTDYEHWVERRSEWPVSNSASTRLILYFLIPVVPIIGSYVFEKLADTVISGAPS
jgi:hypothetical protein